MKIINYRLPRLSLRSSARPPLPLRKKALLIGIQYARQEAEVEVPQENDERTTENDVPKGPKQKKKKKKKVSRDEEGVPKAAGLKGPHRDVLEMKQLLIDFYYYDPNDITVLIDDNNPDHIQPTKENMIKKMSELIAGAVAGDRFVLHFCGHATQEETKSPEEEDGKDELLISSDEEEIKDDLLRELLVDPLPIGCTLNAIFDACHSCTLLDLHHYRCNRVYIPWLNKGRRKTDFPRNIMMRRNAQISFRSVTQVERLSRDANKWKRTSIDQVLSSPTATFDVITKTKKSLSISTDMERWYGGTITESPIERCGSPEAMYCTGECRDKPSLAGLSADVISLSSSKDSQRSWEDSQGRSMTQALIKVLRNDPNPSLRDLLTLVSHDIHLSYVSMHGHARNYKERVKTYNDSRILEGKEIKKPRSVELNNFQDPQLSSPQPLDMNRRWYL